MWSVRVNAEIECPAMKGKPDPLKFSIPLTAHERDDALQFVRSHKVALFVVAYQAERYIERLLDRIPEDLMPYFEEIYIIDDSSSDNTFKIAQRAKEQRNLPNLKVFQTPYNRGYGGNQKLGYIYAISRNYDVTILLHGDCQYPPEYLSRIIAPFKDDSVDAVFASRMITKDAALEGGMPRYKWLGNQVLTRIENLVLGTHFSEFHTGYRAYRIRKLRDIPFKYNDDGFHFDTEIIIQIVGSGGKIKEVPIPTFYGDEKCHVNGISYAFNCVRAVLWYKLTRFGIFYDKRFDINLFENNDSSFKQAPTTMHQYVLEHCPKPGRRVIQLFAGSGRLSAAMAAKGVDMVAADIVPPPYAGGSEAIQINLSQQFDEIIGKRQFHSVIMLDGLQYFRNVGEICERIGLLLKPGGILYASAGNVAYFPLRIFLLFGAFHYGKRGILDLSHKRLFTKNAFVRLIKNSGFKIRKVRGFGPPLRDMISDSWFMRILDSFLSMLARVYPSLFGFQILIEAERLDDVDTILKKTIESSYKKTT